MTDELSTTRRGYLTGLGVTALQTLGLDDDGDGDILDDLLGMESQLPVVVGPDSQRTETPSGDAQLFIGTTDGGLYKPDVEGWTRIGATGRFEEVDGDVLVNLPDGSTRNLSNVGGGVLADAGSNNADGGDRYQLPNAEDSIDLQGAGAIENPGQIGGADVANAASGDVLQSAGAGGLTFGAVSGGIWSTDGNSGQSANGVTSDTVTLSGTYDTVYLRVQITDGGSGAAPELQMNGTTSGYNYVDFSDTRTTSASSATPLIQFGGGDSTILHLWLNGRSAGALKGAQIATQGNSGNVAAWSATNTTSPLDSVTIKAASSFDIVWGVYGADIGSGGV